MGRTGKIDSASGSQHHPAAGRYWLVVSVQPIATEMSLPGRIRAFRPADLPTRPGAALWSPKSEVRYQVRGIGQEGVRPLTGDPTVADDLPVARLVTNAVATFILVLSLGLITAATAPRLLGFGSVVVASGSMEPAIRIADVVVIAPSDGTELGEGAVIDFDHPDGPRLHRIVAVTAAGYRTAGDANRSPDPSVVVPSQVNGVGIVVVPFVGLPKLWFDEGRWFPLVATLAVLTGALYTGRSDWADRVSRRPSR